jgi:hypothetical protein
MNAPRSAIVASRHALGRGGYVRKPRMVPHTFWNPTDNLARVLEIISPARFEAYFRETTPLFDESGKPNLEVIAAMSARYGIGGDMGQVAWIPCLMQRYQLVHRADPVPPPGSTAVLAASRDLRRGARISA